MPTQPSAGEHCLGFIYYHRFPVCVGGIFCPPPLCHPYDDLSFCGLAPSPDHGTFVYHAWHPECENIASALTRERAIRQTPDRLGNGQQQALQGRSDIFCNYGTCVSERETSA